MSVLGHVGCPDARLSAVLWEAIFMLLVLKIPIVYLCVVVWFAVRAEPKPEEPAALVPVSVPEGPLPADAPPWSPRRRRRRRHGPPRRPAGARGRAAAPRAGARR